MHQGAVYQVFIFSKVNNLEMITSRNVKHELAWSVEQSMDENILIQRIFIILQELNSMWHLTI
jgi:hypothetical protein